MKKIFTLFCILVTSLSGTAQSIYNAASYAVNGDTVYLTSAQIDTTNYYNGGANYTWNFKALKGLSQQSLVFRNPKSTGFTQLQWPYIYNAANVNLSSTNFQSIAVGQLEETNDNDYYISNGNTLAQKASSFSVAYSGVSLNIKNTYATADTVYKFPMHYADTFASSSSYTTTLPGIYYNMQRLQRTNKVDGWGTVITPYATFTHCIRIVSHVVQVDTFAVSTVGIPQVTTQYREIKWLDSTKSYPVLYVRQALVGSTYITEQVQYYDKQQYFPPQALFAYVPLMPVINDTVTFQNLSTNSTTYTWNFGDGTTSTTTNPQHVYSGAGTYVVQLVAYNGALADTLSVNIKVNSSSLPIQLLFFKGTQEKDGNLLEWSTATETKTAYFIVQHSMDGRSFQNIASVNAAGNSTSVSNYGYTDASYQQGTNYYRIKTTDINGQFSYSNIVKLQGGSPAGNTILLYPNPTTRSGDVTLAITSNTTSSAMVTIYDANGKQLMIIPVQLKAGSNNITMPVKSLTVGTYFLVCRNTDRGVMGRMTFVVGK